MTLLPATTVAEVIPKVRAAISTAKCIGKKVAPAFTPA